MCILCVYVRKSHQIINRFIIWKQQQQQQQQRFWWKVKINFLNSTHTHTRTRTQVHMCTNTHTHTHTHTHGKLGYVIWQVSQLLSDSTLVSEVTELYRDILYVCKWVFMNNIFVFFLLYRKKKWWEGWRRGGEKGRTAEIEKWAENCEMEVRE